MNITMESRLNTSLTLTLPAPGCADFIPSRTKQDGFFKSGEFEPLHNVVGKARAWAQSQPGLHVVNVQSMDYKLKQGWCKSSSYHTHSNLSPLAQTNLLLEGFLYRIKAETESIFEIKSD
jgi:hypothetical protein